MTNKSNLFIFLLKSKKEKNMALYLKNFNKDLQRQLRILALKRKTTLLALIEKCLKKEVKNDIKK